MYPCRRGYICLQFFIFVTTRVLLNVVSCPFVLRQIYSKWKLFSKYRPLYIYLFMFPILRLHPLLHCAFKSFLCLRIFFVSVPGSQLVGRNTLLSTAPPLSVLRITICPPLDIRRRKSYANNLSTISIQDGNYLDSSKTRGVVNR